MQNAAMRSQQMLKFLVNKNVFFCRLTSKSVKGNKHELVTPKSVISSSKITSRLRLARERCLNGSKCKSANEPSINRTFATYIKHAVLPSNHYPKRLKEKKRGFLKQLTGEKEERTTDEERK